MADQTVEIKFQLRDEISKAAEQAVAKLLRLDQVSTGKARRELDVLGRSAAFAAREIRSLATITGVGGVLGAGGIVAGLVAAKRALDQFVESGIKTHYAARELGASAGMLRNYTDALRVVGQSEGEAAGGVQSALRTLEEAWTEGRGSSMFRQLAKGVGDTGTKVFRELMQTYGREGPEAALNLALKRIEGMSARAQAHFSRIMGFGTVGATELRRILPQLVPVIRMSKEQMLQYQVANINLDRTWGNIKTQIGTALLPAFTELTKAIDQYLRSDAGKKFLADIKRWINSISDAIKSEGFAQTLDAIVKDTEQAVVELGKAYDEADKVVHQMGLTWPQVFGLLIGSGILVFLSRLAASLAGIARFRMMFPQLLAI